MELLRSLRLLTQAGGEGGQGDLVEEPLRWSPPADCLAGMDLPGRDPEDQGGFKVLVIK